MAFLLIIFELQPNVRLVKSLTLDTHEAGGKEYSLVSGNESNKICHYLPDNKLQIRLDTILLVHLKKTSFCVLCFRYVSGQYMSDKSTYYIIIIFLI